KKLEDNKVASYDPLTFKVTIVENKGSYKEVKVYVRDSDYYAFESKTYTDVNRVPILFQQNDDHKDNSKNDRYDDDDLDHDGFEDDVLLGKNLDDRIYGKDGDDFLDGESGNDYLDGGVGDDILRGGSGKDKLHGGLGDDDLSGGDGKDKLYGEDGDDDVTGGAGDDSVYGGKGDDYLYAGTGIGLQKHDVIADFQKHFVTDDFVSGDLIDLSAIDATKGLGKNDPFEWIDNSDDVTRDNANGALWFNNGVLYGSTDKDVEAEFQIELTGVTSLNVHEIVL
ncbi:MAG: hypothetical protein LUQ06_01815, partial [Methylococcaceae bacterium]|nr:hypothetical protein [Methylococcaceae bacterium]